MENRKKLFKKASVTKRYTPGFACVTNRIIMVVL
jgi:hypothetical protein